MTMNRVQLEGSPKNRKATAEELRDVPPITSRAEYFDVINSEEYRTSQWAKEIVSAAVGKSDHRVLFGDGSPTNSEPEKASPAMIAARQDVLHQMFRDPRYKTSAAYRYEVEQKVKELTQNDVYHVPDNATKAGGGTTSVSLSTRPDQAAEIRTVGVQRVQFTGEPKRNFVGEALTVKRPGSN